MMSEHDGSTLVRRPRESAGLKYFGVEQANRSLVLVGRVVRDVLALYCQARRLEEHYSVLDRQTERAERKLIKRRYEALLRRLPVYSAELAQIGCRLRDWQTGAIDWPATIDGREIYLCWRMGDDAIGYYHEAYESFAARRRLTDEMRGQLEDVLDIVAAE